MLLPRLIKKLDQGLYRACFIHMATATLYVVFSIFIVIEVNLKCILSSHFKVKCFFYLSILQYNSSEAYALIVLGVVQIITFCFLGTLVSISVSLSLARHPLNLQTHEFFEIFSQLRFVMRFQHSNGICCRQPNTRPINCCCIMLNKNTFSTLRALNH